jgi:hypothetical protein
MNSESYGLSKLPYIKNNRLFSGRPKPKKRPFSCLPNKNLKKNDFLSKIPSALVQKKINLEKKLIGIEHIIKQSTQIRRKSKMLPKPKVELDVDQPIQFELYDKGDPVLRDILNGVKKKSGFRIKRRKRKKTKEGPKEAKRMFRLHRAKGNENINKSNVGEKARMRMEDSPLQGKELFNRDEMTRCALKYLPPEIKYYDEDSLSKEYSHSFVDIYSECQKEIKGKQKRIDKKKSYLKLKEKTFLSIEDPKKKPQNQDCKLENDFINFVNKKMKNVRKDQVMGKEKTNEARQRMALNKMKQRQNEEEQFKSPSERIGRYMQFSSVLQKEHLLEVLDLIEGVSKKEKKEGEIPIQLVCWNDRLGLNRIQRVGAAYYEDVDTLLKRNCFMVYPEFLDPTLKVILVQEKIINKIDFRDRLRPTEEYYKWLLSKSRNTYDPIFLSRLALDPPSLEDLPMEIAKMIQMSTVRYNDLIGPDSPISAKELSPYRKNWIEIILKKVDHFLVENYRSHFKTLWREIFDEYILVGRRIIVDYALRYHRERKRWGIHLLKRPNLSFSQKIFECGGYHRQFHDRWHRLFENSKRFMTKEFFGVNSLSLALHQWFHSFRKTSLTELRLTTSLGHLNRALSPKEFFLFQEFYRKMMIGFLNQILIRGAYFLIKKRKLFCRQDLMKMDWTVTGCGQIDSSVESSKLTQSEIHFLLRKLKKKKDKTDYEDVIEILRNLQRKDKQVSNQEDFRELMMHTKLTDLEVIQMENDKVNLENTRFSFPANSSWDNHIHIREDFKIKILEGPKTNQTKEELLGQEKLEKTLGTLMGLRLRELLAGSIEDILGFFEAYSEDNFKDLMGGKGSAKMLKRINNETHSPIFKVELVIDNGVLKLGEIQKKLIEELNSFFLGLCQSFKNVRKPKYVNIKYAKNIFKKKIKQMNTEEQAKSDVKVDTVLGKLLVLKNLF